MNPVQRLIGLIGVICIIFVAAYPAWIVEGRVRYDFTRKFDDNDRTDHFVEVETFVYKGLDRGCVFAARGEPDVRYQPSPLREYEDKKGYATSECVNVDVVDYSYTVDSKKMMIEFFVVLVPTLLLILVFMQRKED